MLTMYLYMHPNIFAFLNTVRFSINLPHFPGEMLHLVVTTLNEAHNDFCTSIEKVNFYWCIKSYINFVQYRC